MTHQRPHGSSENVLEYALLAINQSRINCVHKNVPFEESYLIKKKKYDHLLDLKFCHLRRGSTATDSSTSPVGGVVSGGCDEDVGDDGHGVDRGGGGSPPCHHGNLAGILPIRNRAGGQGHNSAYFILRQWCEKFDKGYDSHREGNLKRGDNLSEQEYEFKGRRGPSCERTHFPISYVIIATHRHGNGSAPCSYGEMTVEIPNYDVEVDGFYVQIHVDPNEEDIFILSSKEIILIKKKEREKKKGPIRGEYLLHNKHLNIPSKRKIIKADWFQKSAHVISLLTYEHMEASKFYTFKFKSVIRLINVEGEIKEEVKIVVPDMDVILRKLKNEKLEDIKKDLYKMEKINSSVHEGEVVSGESGTEQIQRRGHQQYHGNNVQGVETPPNNNKLNGLQGQNDQDGHTNISSVETHGEGKNSSSSHPICSDLAVVSPKSRTDLAFDHVLRKGRKQLAKKNKYKNLVVDYCFGYPSENIPWIETCLFVLLKDGIILIYTPIITNEWYISYFLMHELNRIRQRGMENGGGTNGEPSDAQGGDDEKMDEEYAEDFLSHYNHFRGVSVREYRAKDVWVCFNRGEEHSGVVTGNSPGGRHANDHRRNDGRSGAAFSYIPYVIKCMRRSSYRSIGLLYCNHLVFIIVTDKFGYVSFVVLNYLITPHIVLPTPGHSEADTGNTFKKAINFLSVKKKKESFFFNIFNLKDNAIFENLSSADLANLVNRDRYDEYYRRVKNSSYEMASLIGKMSQRSAAMECANMEEVCHQGGENNNGVDCNGGDVGTSLQGDAHHMQHQGGANMEETKIDAIKVTSQKTQKKKAVFKERFTKRGETNEKRKHKHSTGSTYISDRNITERDNFFSCYEDEKEIFEKQINEEINIQCQPLSVLYFDAYYTGMSNVKMIVLNNHSLLCFNNEKVIHLHLVWVKFVSAIFYLIHLKNFLSAKLIHEMCKNGLYMSTTIFKAAISFYQFDYYAYLLLDHTKRLNRDTFAGLFSGGRDGTREPVIQLEGAEDNFDRLQSSALYDVQYALHPVVVQENNNSGNNRSISSEGPLPPSEVYLIFTHYINLSSQRKEKLFMSRNISFFTSSVYKNLFIVYDCFKMTIVTKPGNRNLSSQGRNRTHLLVRQKRKCKVVCQIPGQAKLRNFNMNTELVDYDSIDLNMYSDMLSFYVNSRCNDYMNSLIKKNFIFYQGKGTLCNIFLNRDARVKGESMLRRGTHTLPSRKMITPMYSDGVGANSSLRLPYCSDSNDVGEHPLNAHSTEEINFLKNVFVILHSNDSEDGKDIHKRNPMCEESGADACKKYKCGVGYTIDQVNPEKLINDIKVHVLKGDSKKYDNVPCTILLKKLIKVKNDYINVKDYFLKKKKINLDSLPTDVEGKINLLEQVVKVYYFFLDLNFYYERKFEKIKKRIIHSLAVDVIHFIKSHASIQNMSKALIEKNTTLVKDIQLCYQKHQLIQEKFNLLRKRILLHSLVNTERFTVKWANLNEG
ncbi:conserved Plasmodium protein, unknown function [Plasmodium knowlesi strain H]|uniref:Uncharacterized protein n=3 Tax=Plasmodium knowlesi TaxID=5850 RepID=A0A5K1U957_PLAKH|nr:conserved Plasmodium protein, unknown function [Plasmodium knowlesi strain H]OTN66756.1 Uncharacterized protein PKNOH_S08482700 [Plasmodium knowlesi]CAA9990151.1 conserved Plasmodium protein, unknown function [Plasmodium knowlesi strain H]SBO25841.1 conserved Plasmodium protein, unknown function [Plasmodium knowlesi strain H]SBO28624.1 conserved Plasmodium protein, unknown function [Plasmodium knowlesi strain H]VVS79625.1 conserved Plasmodium protein, unknown function [Plasmodium knowlesi s|eukprot:XP_002260618.1 hypothetical protein, conserved in Plasmodium species [Plasmodium knowlesi strain H]